jgi:hypothetical protein
MPTDKKATDKTTGDGATDTAALQSEVEKWKALARKHEENAKANATKAKQFDDLEASSKSDIEKLTEQVEALRQDNATAQQESLRLRIATEHKVSAEDMVLLTGTDEATLKAQAERLAGRSEEKRRGGSHVPGEGKQPDKNAGDSELRDFARNLFNRD